MIVEYIEINGASLAFRLIGNDHEPLIITLHGGRGMGDHRSDFNAYSPLIKYGYRVLSFDYRGHGQSSHSKPYSFEQIVDDIEGIRQHFAGLETTVIICGGSFGGFLALHYAIKYSKWVKKLILRGTAASYHQEEGAIKILAERLHKVPSFTMEMLQQKVFGKFESDLEFRLVHLAMLPLYSENFDGNAALHSVLDNHYNAEAHNELYSEKEKYFDYRSRLKEIMAPTLVIVGEKDWICPIAYSEFLARNIPKAELFVVKDANHSVHLEKNEIVIERIVSFLGGHSS